MGNTPAELVGTWSEAMCTVEGVSVTERTMGCLQLVISPDGKWKNVLEGAVVSEGTLTADNTSTPKRVAFTFAKSRQWHGIGKVVNSIYEIEDNKLRISGGKPGAASPPRIGNGSGIQHEEYDRIS